jgi:hypothetical protein
VWYSDDLSMIRIDGAWRIVHKTFYHLPRGEGLPARSNLQAGPGAVGE